MLCAIQMQVWVQALIKPHSFTQGSYAHSLVAEIRELKKDPSHVPPALTPFPFYSIQQSFTIG